ncbi:MAG: pyridoxal phosphate-dependent aminotransferase [Bryobacteraceae bacterium]
MYLYSQRLPWQFSTNSLSRLVQEKKRAGFSIIDLTISNPTEVLSDYPHAAIGRAYAGIEDFKYRPDARGQDSARAAIAEYYRSRGSAISPEQILLTASTSEAYALLFKLFCNPEDEVLAPAPSYPLFEFLAGLESVRTVPYRLQYDGAWFIDFNHLKQRISERTRAIVVVNPNNPTGSFLKEWEVEKLIALAREHELPIVSDEVFMEYGFGNAGERVPTLVERDTVLSFSLNGLSKTAGMPQMKLGWIAINGPAKDREIAHDRLELLLDTYLSVAGPVQAALPELLDIGMKIQREIAERATQNLDTLRQILSHSPAQPLHTEGGWSAIVQLPNTFSGEVWATRILNEQNVIVQPGYFFDFASEAYVVLSLIAPAEDFAEGIRRLRDEVLTYTL